MTAPVLLALCLGFFAGGCVRQESGPRPEILSRIAHPVIIVGIDGATWDVVDPLIGAGQLPHFHSLMNRGVRGTLISLPPYSSPVVWTTIATGRFPRDHGILDHVQPFGPGEKRPVDATLREVPAIWSIAEAYGLKAGVVGYFVTHPPERLGGFMVSDRAAQGVQASVQPESLEPEMAAILAELSERSERVRLIRRFVAWNYDRRTLEDPESPWYEATQIIADRVDHRVVKDEFVRRATLELLPRKPDLFLTYFRMVDHASHASWIYYDDSDFDRPASPRERALLQDLIPEAYRYLDEILGQIVETVGADANVLVVSDHGFGSATGPYAGPANLQDHITGNHRPDGILLAAGPAFRTGIIEGATIVDLAPTLLALLRVPISAELPGRVLTELLAPGYLDEHATERVPAYDITWDLATGATPDREAEDESMKTLRSLGYIGGGTGRTEREPESPVTFWEAQTGLKRRALVGEMLYYLLEGDKEGATELASTIRRHSPRLLRHVEHQLSTEVELLEEKIGRDLVDDDLFAAALDEPSRNPALERSDRETP